MRLPREIGPIHFVGIGGIGMSGIAEVLLNLGYQVSGSDLKESEITRRLTDLGGPLRVRGAIELKRDGSYLMSGEAAPGPGAGPAIFDIAKSVGLDVERLRSFHAERYVPNQMIVAVVGVFGATTLVGLLVTGLVQRLKLWDPVVLAYLGGMTAAVAGLLVYELSQSDLAAALTMSAIGSCASTASISSIRARVTGCFGVKSVQQSSSGMIEIG